MTQTPETHAVAGIIDGTAVAAKVREATKERAAEFTARHGRQPGLATLLVGDNPASATYVAGKHRAAAALGIATIDEKLPATATQAEVESVVAALVARDEADGVLVQMPLPDGLDPEPVILLVPPEKDVDGFHPTNVGAIATGLHGTASCTPAGVMTLLDHYEVELPGADVVVVGRSRTVGMPMALLLLQRNATVTVTHLLTKDLARATRQADVLVVAAGHPGLITRDMVKPGAVVIDIGITRTEDGLKGDVAFDEVAEVARLISPVPGGVGPMTIATLMSHTVALAWARAGK
jgi:methylenetetrahydrofolate dehydrogenase (NADP+)/methenyltetrahydrofolate cyclohydrolase